MFSFNNPLVITGSHFVYTFPAVISPSTFHYICTRMWSFYQSINFTVLWLEKSARFTDAWVCGYSTSALWREKIKTSFILIFYMHTRTPFNYTQHVGFHFNRTYVTSFAWNHRPRLVYCMLPDISCFQLIDQGMRGKNVSKIFTIGFYFSVFCRRPITHSCRCDLDCPEWPPSTLDKESSGERKLVQLAKVMELHNLLRLKCRDFGRWN